MGEVMTTSWMPSLSLTPPTTTDATPNFEELAALVALALPRLEWRRHGIGALQAYISTPDAAPGAPEVRVHIWHPDLFVPGVGTFPRNVHTHRFELRSTVLTGRLHHTHYDVRERLHGLYQPHEVTHARVQGKNELPTPIGGPVDATVKVSWVFSPGETYWFPRGEYHNTEVDELAVTIITKLDQDDGVKARVLAHVGEQPTHGFVSPMDEVEIARYVRLAGNALARGHR